MSTTLIWTRICCAKEAYGQQETFQPLCGCIARGVVRIMAIHLNVEFPLLHHWGMHSKVNYVHVGVNLQLILVEYIQEC